MLKLSGFMALQLALFLVLYAFQFSDAIPPENSHFDEWFTAAIDDAPHSLKYLFNEKKITNVDIQKLGHSALCLIARSCDNTKRSKAFTTLLDLGGDPDQDCETADIGDRPLINVLVYHRCEHLVSKLVHHERVNETILNDCIPLSSAVFSGFVPIVQFAALETEFNVERDINGFGTLAALLSQPKLDINQRTSTNVSAVKAWCLNFQPSSPLSFMLDSALKLLWSRPDLDDEQRELILNRCGYRRILTEPEPNERIWKISLQKDIQLGSNEFFQHHLQGVLTSSRKPNVVNRRLKIVGLTAQDEGGVVASFLEDLTAAAFAFGGHQLTSLKDISEHVRISVTDTRNEMDELEKVFSPAPSSLLLFKGNANDSVSVRVRKNLKAMMRAAGILIGACLNTLFYSETLSLGVPLDRVVLKRLIDPTSAIERSDVLDSAVFIKAFQMLNWGYSLSEAQKQFPTSWPVIPFDQSSSMSEQTQSAKMQKEWEDYSVALVGRLLTKKHSRAFASMLAGFRATIPQGQKTHLFNAALAHRMLLGETRVTMDMLQSRLAFSSNEDVDVLCQVLFVTALKDLYDEDPQNLNRFLKEVTGSSQLQKSSLSPPITIDWMDASSHNSDIRYIASTCTSTLWLFPTTDAQTMRAILQGVISSSRKYAFNMI